MRLISTTLVLAVALSGAAYADPKAEKPAHDSAAQKGTPPGLAKKGGVPPGLAKLFGTNVPQHAYIAVDPRHDDRAWFLINDRWVLRRDLTPEVRTEVRHLMTLPGLPDPPPIPLPTLDAPLHVVHFG